MEAPLSIDELKKLGQKLGLRPKDFIRKGEDDFKKLDLSSNLDNDKILFDYTYDHLIYFL